MAVWRQLDRGPDSFMSNNDGPVSYIMASMPPFTLSYSLFALQIGSRTILLDTWVG